MGTNLGAHRKRRDSKRGRTAAELFGYNCKNDFPQESMQAAQCGGSTCCAVQRSCCSSTSRKFSRNSRMFPLQIAAAQSLQQLAIEYERPSDLLAAIEESGGFSPIWGWGKLSLHFMPACHLHLATPVMRNSWRCLNIIYSVPVPAGIPNQGPR